MAQFLIDQTHQIVSELKRLAGELGRPPRRDELKDLKCAFSKHSILSVFGTYTEALKAAGLDKKSAKETKKPEKIKYKKTQIDGIFIHEFDLDKLFEQTGKDVITLVAQPDTHIKHKDDKATSIYLEIIHDIKPDIDLILGDFLDAEGVSHWPPDSLEEKRIVPEILSGREFLGHKVAVTPDTKERIFLWGNHEDWFRQALLQMPNLFHGISEICPEFNLGSMLGLDKYGYREIPLNHLLKIGKAHFTHGVYTGDSHAKAHLSKFKVNIFYGHLHDTQSYCDTSAAGTLVAQSLGCLCKLDARFLRGKINNWKQAFGVFYFRRDGSFTHYVVPIVDGVAVFNGKTYRG